MKLCVVKKTIQNIQEKLSLCKQFKESACSAIFQFLKGTADPIVKSSILAHARNLLEFENRPHHIVHLLKYFLYEKISFTCVEY